MFEKNSTFFIMKKVVPLVIKVAPFAFLINSIMRILHGSMWCVITIVAQYFFDAINKYI